MAGESGTIRFKPSLKGRGLSLQLKKKKKKKLDSKFLAYIFCRKCDTSSWLRKSESLQVVVSFEVRPSNCVTLYRVM